MSMKSPMEFHSRLAKSIETIGGTTLIFLRAPPRDFNSHQPRFAPASALFDVKSRPVSELPPARERAI